MLTLNTGVTHIDVARASRGLVLIAPAAGRDVYLVNYDGEVVHQWRVKDQGITFWCYLTPDGTLFTNERAATRKGVALTGSGWMREYEWDGALLWEHHDPYQHHDARRLPDGGCAYLAFSDMPLADQARVRGGVPGTETDAGLCGEAIREVDATGTVVWEWDMASLGFDQFALHANANRWSRGHTNTIAPVGDTHYLISCKTLNLLFMVARDSGTVTWHYQNDEMGGQHDAQMLANGHILIFANGAYARDLHHSQVWELDPATNDVVWRYGARDNPQSFFSPHIGGCQRLSSGNTLICEGAKGCVFEVTPDGDVVWEYVNPYANPSPDFGRINWLFRARHYQPDGPEVRGRA